MRCSASIRTIPAYISTSADCSRNWGSWLRRKSNTARRLSCSRAFRNLTPGWPCCSEPDCHNRTRRTSKAGCKAPPLTTRPAADALCPGACSRWRGEYARAAEYVGRGHDLSAATVKEHRKYNAVAHERLVDRFLATFDRAFFERVGGHGLDTQQPVFVFGLPRSGTTLVEQILASHSKIHGAGELRLARDTFDSLPSALQRPGRPIDAAAMAGPDLAVVARRHLDRLRALDPTRSPRIVDKMPDNYLYCGLLAAMFPRATFIHCRRDLRRRHLVLADRFSQHHLGTRRPPHRVTVSAVPTRHGSLDGNGSRADP